MLDSRWTKEPGQHSKCTVCFFEFSIPFFYNPRNLPKLQRILLANIAPAAVGAQHFSHSLSLCSGSTLPKSSVTIHLGKIYQLNNKPTLILGMCQFSSKLWQSCPLDRNGEEPQFGHLGDSLVPRHPAPCQLQACKRAAVDSTVHSPACKIIFPF